MPTVVIAIARPKFPLGQIVITANAQGQLDPADVQQGFSRHARGDWGEVCPEDREQNEFVPEARRPAVVGLSVRATSASGSSPKRDRSVTTVLMPEDY